MHSEPAVCLMCPKNSPIGDLCTGNMYVYPFIAFIVVFFYLRKMLNSGVEKRKKGGRLLRPSPAPNPPTIFSVMALSSVSLRSLLSPVSAEFDGQVSHLSDSWRLQSCFRCPPCLLLPSLYNKLHGAVNISISFLSELARYNYGPIKTPSLHSSSGQLGKL